MRIISGTAKGRRLRLFKGRHIRPTADRVREALFSSLQSRLGSFEGLRVLDLFCGTGALALEALSRGANEAILVDQSGNSGEIATANIRTCAMQTRARFYKIPVSVFLQKPPIPGPFDLIFLDPPYNKGLISPTLEGIVTHHLLAAGGIVCVEAPREEVIPSIPPEITLQDHRSYGSTSLYFFILSKSGEDQA